MRQLLFSEPGVVHWDDVPDPTLAEPTDAIVRPLAVARCDLDLPMAMAGIFPGPFPIGHETVAEIVEVGRDVESLTPGERVVVPFQVSCGRCGMCGSGRFGGCEAFTARAGAAFGFGAAGGGHGGALSDLLRVPFAEHMLVPAPDGGDPIALATVPDNLIDGYRTVAEPLRRFPGGDVLVVNALAPSIGLYAVVAALALGAGRVRYADRDPERLAAAEALGAEVEEVVKDWPRRFERAPITVDATGDPAGLSAVLASTEPYGYCTSAAIYFGDVSLPLLSMYTRGITFHSSRADSRRYLPEVLPLVADGRLEPLAVPTTVVEWDAAPDAWLAPATKLVVERAQGSSG